MKKILTAISLSLAILILMTGTTGCQKHGINGDLDGMWQIMEIDEFGAEGQIQNTFTPDSKYISFQLHVCQLRDENGTLGAPGTANMTYRGNTLSLSFPYANTEEKIDRLAEWGIFTPTPVFTIETLTGSTLVMRSDHARLRCRKF